MKTYLIDTHGVFCWLYHHHVKSEVVTPGVVMVQTTGTDVPEPFSEVFSRWCRIFSREVGEDSSVVYCLESATSWRRDLCPEYKANRRAKPKDKELAEQLKLLPSILKSLGVTTAAAEGNEADDVIATLSVGDDDDNEVLIVSQDKDLFQLVTPRVSIYNPKTGEVYKEKEATEKLGFPPYRQREWLALKGDPSDNIRGVTGWGETSATRAIQQTRSFSELKRKAALGVLVDIRDKTQKNAAVEADELELSYKLAGLNYGAPVVFGRVSIQERESTEDDAGGAVGSVCEPVDSAESNKGFEI